jgi:mRNA deadenylase 3'-5' endonuclease subunit Ccr4
MHLSTGDHGCPEWAHKWSYRKRKILWEVLHSRADIVCFQEIEKRAYEGYARLLSTRRLALP